MKPIFCQLVILACVLLGISWKLFPVPESAFHVEDVPRKGLYFQSTDIPLSRAEVAALGEAEAIKRLYHFHGEPFVVTVIDGTKNRAAVHDVALCLRGAAGKIVHSESLSLSRGTAHLYRSEEGEEILSWYSSPRKQHGSFFQYRLSAAIHRLSFGKLGDDSYHVIVQRMVQSNEPYDWKPAIREWFPQMGI